MDKLLKSIIKNKSLLTIRKNKTRFSGLSRAYRTRVECLKLAHVKPKNGYMVFIPDEEDSNERKVITTAVRACQFDNIYIRYEYYRKNLFSRAESDMAGDGYVGDIFLYFKDFGLSADRAHISPARKSPALCPPCEIRID